MQITIMHDKRMYIIPTITFTKPVYKPSLRHRFGICHKALKGYTCRAGNNGKECE